MLSLTEHPHRRFNPLTGEWVLVSPHRMERPWQGQVEKIAAEVKPQYDPECYLCPGNARAGGVRNPQYTSTFVFNNDFAALLPQTPPQSSNQHDLLIAQGEPGICEVVCLSPRHDLTLAQMSQDEIKHVIDIWAERWLELGAQDFIHYVQLFENRGAMMGASNPHPHCQIWATANIPDEPLKEQQQLLAYSQKHSSCLLCDYAALETSQHTRIVIENDCFVAVVPFWAVWPFEMLLISKAHISDLATLDGYRRHELASTLRQITDVYDRVFDAPFPYTMGFHQRPTDGQRHLESHLHAHFYPPLLRSAMVRKFMVGFEMLGTPQRDLTSEIAAERLRSLAERARIAEQTSAAR